MRVLREIIITLILGILIFVFLRLTVQSYKVEGMSMMDGIQHGQYLLVNKAVYFLRLPQRGEVIVFHPPQRPEAQYIKRVIALPNEMVEVKNGKVFVNGTPLIEPYIKESPKYTVLPEKIPPGHYFVLGDNRNHSQDSHQGWTVPSDQIIGKAWISLWPPQKWGLIEHYPFTGAQIIESPELSVVWQRACPIE